MTKKDFLKAVSQADDPATVRVEMRMTGWCYPWHPAVVLEGSRWPSGMAHREVFSANLTGDHETAHIRARERIERLLRKCRKWLAESRNVKNARGIRRR